MFRTFLGELGHLAFDRARVDSVAARLEPLLDQLRQQQLIPLVQTLWSGAVALRQPRLQDLQATRERQPVHIEILPLGRLQHQRSHHEVAKRQGVQLLLHTRRRLAAQMRGLGRAPGILVRPLLVKDEFFFPTLLVGSRANFYSAIELRWRKLKGVGLSTRGRGRETSRSRKGAAPAAAGAEAARQVPCPAWAEPD